MERRRKKESIKGETTSIA